MRKDTKTIDNSHHIVAIFYLCTIIYRLFLIAILCNQKSPPLEFFAANY